MKATFRAKLFAIFGATLLALVSVLVVSTWMGVRQSRELDDVQGRLVPKTELGPRVLPKPIDGNQLLATLQHWLSPRSN